MAILEQLQNLVPRWMVTAPRQAFAALMSGPAAMLDALTEASQQARIAALPGQSRLGNIPGLGGYDSVDALFPIARDRLVTPAQVDSLPWVIEKPWQLALRLRNWRDDWTNNTGPFGLLDQLAYVMGPTIPILRFVQASNGITSWYTRSPNGDRRLQRSDGNGWAYTLATGALVTDTTTAQAWNWDSTSTPPPPDQNDQSRGWLIAYAPFGGAYVTRNDLTFADLGVVDDAWNSPAAQVNGQPTAGVCGSNAPAGYVTLVQNIVSQRRTAGCKIVYLIVAFDAASFNPDGSSSAGASLTAYPAGAWGWDTTPGTSGGAPTRLIARLQTAEYWRLTDTVPVIPPV